MTYIVPPPSPCPSNTIKEYLTPILLGLNTIRVAGGFYPDPTSEKKKKLIRIRPLKNNPDPDCIITLGNKTCNSNFREILNLMFRPDQDPTKFRKLEPFLRTRCRIRPYFVNWIWIQPKIRNRNPAFKNQYLRRMILLPCICNTALIKI